MTFEEKILDIINTMVEFNLIDSSRLYDSDYIAERVLMYLNARNFVLENFKGCF